MLVGEEAGKTRLLREQKQGRPWIWRGRGWDGAGAGWCRGVVWGRWEAGERQVGMTSSEMGLIVGSDSMRSEF